MLIIECRLLTGRYAAGAFNDPTTSEWPPHPARVFSALTAALHDDAPPADDARAALEWLARAGAPEIIASGAAERWLAEVYVPTNDAKALADVDGPILAMEEAKKALAVAEGNSRPKAERTAERAEAKMRERSLATSAADGGGTPGNAAELLDRRPRQPRYFPTRIPDNDVIHYRWEESPASALASALDRLCAGVARLGHSSSLVSMRVVDAEAEVGGRRRWVPDRSGDRYLRVPVPEQLLLLEESHQRHIQVEARVLPADDQRSWYRERGAEDVRETAVGSRFSDAAAEWLVYEVVPPSEGGRRRLLDLSLAQHVARAMRGALLSSLGSRTPETLSGHDAEGRPTSVPHLAFVALGDVGHPHATASILGVALVPPRELAVADRDALIEAVFRAEQAGGSEKDLDARRVRLTLGRSGVVHLRRLHEPARLRTLLPGRWCGPSRRWATATAVALDRNPGNLRARDAVASAQAAEVAERTVAEACENIGLPAPAAVWVHRRSLLEGAPPARAFMPFPNGGSGPRRVCVHAEVVFDRAVRGPVLLGAGRYFGLGLCVPYVAPNESGRDE